MKKVLFLCFLLLSVSSTFAQQTQTAQLSPEKLKLREELESDKTILQISCGEFRGIREIEKIEKIEEEDSRVRLLLYRASQSFDKTVKAKRKCFSIEATPMVGYLIVEKGKISYVADYSRDKFGGNAFEKYDCSKLSIGTFALNDKKSATIFTPLEEKDFAGKTFSLQCKTENREFVF